MEKNEIIIRFMTDFKKSVSTACRFWDIAKNCSTYEEAISLWENILEENERKRREKISKSSKGRTHIVTEETRKKLSESHKGQKAWNKDKTLSEETKRKISEGTKKGMIGFKSTEKQLANLNPYSRVGSHCTEEDKEKKRISNIKAWENKKEDWSEKMKEQWKNRKNPSFLSVPDFVKKYPDGLAVCTIERRLKDAGIEPAFVDKNLCLYNEDDLLKVKRMSGTSHPEQEIADFIKFTYNGTIIQNDRQAIKPKELDIYIPEKKLAIEFDGLFWHSVSFKAKQDEINKHLNKTLSCEQQNIRLMHIYEDEWNEKQEIVKSMISSALGVFQRKIFARKCEVRKVNKKEALEFVKKNHIQETNQISLAYGLYYNEELVQIVTLRKNFAQRTLNKDWELGRMCTLINNQVVGGFSKLIKYVKSDLGITKLTSFVDRRLFNASGYKSSGWKIVGESGPRYFYTDGKIRENRQKYMKQTCLKKWPEFNDKMTEEEMCYKKGLKRIYDCGCLKVEI